MEISLTLPIILSSTALVIGLISLWLTDKRHVLTGSIIYNFLAAIQYVLIGNYTQGALQLFSSGRIYLAKVFEGNKKLAWVLILIGALLLIITYKEWYNLLSFLAFSSGTIAFFFYDKIKMRVLFINRSRTQLLSRSNLSKLANSYIRIYSSNLKCKSYILAR